MKRIIQALCVLNLMLAASTPAQGAIHLVGASETVIFNTIQDCIDAPWLNDGDTCLVLPGTYFENVNFNGRDIVVRSSSGPDATIIDGGFSGSVVTFANGETASTLLEGFTIRHGFADQGGGVTCVDASPTISGCVITRNIADSMDDSHAADGGGIFCSRGEPVIRECTITGNIVRAMDASGGGICALDASPTISRCTVRGNAATGYQLGYGGGIAAFGASPEVQHCVIKGNTASGSKGAVGGGIYIGADSGVVTNCLISHNDSLLSAGGIAVTGVSTALTHCTVANNHSGFGGGIAWGSDSGTISNCIVWDNTGTEGSQIRLGVVWNGGMHSYSGNVEVSYCDVMGGEPGVAIESGSSLAWGAGNLDEPPLFTFGPEGAYYLSQVDSGQADNSPCVNAASPVTESWGWSSLTTRTDQVPDAAPADLGYHYAPQFCLLEPANGSVLSEVPILRWAEGPYNLFRVILLLPLPGGYQLLFSEPSDAGHLDLATFASIWEQLTHDTWSAWFVQGTNTTTLEWELSPAWWFMASVP